MLAAETPTPAPTQTQAAPAEKRIDVSFRGTLRDALKRIANDGGLNVVATGDLDTSVEVHLKGVTAEQVLRIIARTYSLRLDQEGSIYTLRPMTAAEKGDGLDEGSPVHSGDGCGERGSVYSRDGLGRSRASSWASSCGSAADAARGHRAADATASSERGGQQRTKRSTRMRSRIGSARRCAGRSGATRVTGTWWRAATRWR